jgi:acyl-CoA thioester hydrolase
MPPDFNLIARWGRTTSADGEPRALLEVPFVAASYEIDYAGIVSNQVYLRWLEDMRTAFMARWLSLEGAYERGQVPVLTRTEIDYRVSLRLGESSIGRMWAGKIGRARGEIASEIRRASDGRICAAALQTVAFVDAKSGRPTRFPAEFATALSSPD